MVSIQGLAQRKSERTDGLLLVTGLFLVDSFLAALHSFDRYGTTHTLGFMTPVMFCSYHTVLAPTRDTTFYHSAMAHRTMTLMATSSLESVRQSRQLLDNIGGY